MRSHLKTPWLKCVATALTLALSAELAAAGDSPYEVRLIGGSWAPEAGISGAALRSLEQRAAALPDKASGNVHALVQLYEIPDGSQRASLEREGIRLGAYVPGTAFMATIAASDVSTLARSSALRAVLPWTAERKTHPRVKARDIDSYARHPERRDWVMMMVLLHGEVDLARGEEIARQVGGVATKPVVGLHGLTIWLPESRMAELAAIEDVMWIEQGAVPLTPNNDGIRGNMKIDSVTASPYDLDGTGVDLFVYDGGRVLADHVTFDPGTGSRVTSIDSAAIKEHATHVAGTAAGDGSGSSGGRGKGVATGVDILSAGYEWTLGPDIFYETAGDIEADYATARHPYGADLATNSLGSNAAANSYSCSIEGNYGVTSSLIDGIIRGDNAAVDGTMIVTWAAGNERHAANCGSNYGTSAPPACAKNPIHVGAINSDGSAMTWFSGWGPCDDGRLKPIVVAPGCETGRVTGETFIYSSVCSSGGFCSDPNLYGAEYYCGTSMATPAVAGSLALLYGDWNDHSPFLFGFRPLPALVKAMTIQTARDLGTVGPDYRTGYGAVDTKALIDLYRAGTGLLSQPGPVVFGSTSLEHAETDTYSINVPAGVGVLKATLAWDDAAAAAFSANALVNDLDLWLVAPDGTTIHRPWVLDPANPRLAATTGINTRDNQEQVVVINPVAGTWTLRVKGTNVPSGPQTYGLAYSYEARSINEAACAVTQTSSFESGNDGWTLGGGAARVAAPGTGHGSFSILLGGANSATHTVSRNYTVPIGGRYEWSFDLYVQAAAPPSYLTFDSFFAEVRDSNGNVLSVLDFHNNGELLSTWLPQVRLDLSKWGGQTIQLVFFATTDGSGVTSFWVDDVRITTCVADATTVRTSFTSTAAEDGHVIESTETSSVGGTVDAVGSNSPFIAPTLRVGDWNADEQVRGFLSFDTSSLPDTATILWARVRLRRNAVTGTDPFTTHGNLYASMRNGAFNGNAALEAGDWQAAVTAGNVSLFSQPFSDGAYTWATLNSAGLAAINKAGLTQFRLSFFLFDDDDLLRDTVNFNSGESSTTSYKPTLEIAYLP